MTKIKKVAKKAGKKINVRLASLTKPLEIKRCNVGTTLSKFLTDNGLVYGSSVKVGGLPSKASYKLKANDIISIVGNVSGGM